MKFQELEYKEDMFRKNNTTLAPWHIIRADHKTEARVEALEIILEKLRVFLEYSDISSES